MTTEPKDLRETGELEWRWVTGDGRAMTKWTDSTPPPVLDLSDAKGTMHVEVRATPPAAPREE